MLLHFLLLVFFFRLWLHLNLPFQFPFHFSLVKFWCKTSKLLALGLMMLEPGAAMLRFFFALSAFTWLEFDTAI